MAIPGYRISSGSWRGEDLRNLYERAQTPAEWLPQMFEACRNRDMIPFASVFDIDGVAVLESVNCPMFKISSFDIINIELVAAAASTGQPIIMSTGMAKPEEIERAVNACRAVGNDDITLLHCVSSYPARMNEMNLRTMEVLRNRYKVKVGISDHTPGHAVAVAATAMGADIIEKHICLPGLHTPDSHFSMTPEEFKDMMINCDAAEAALGEVKFGGGESSDLRPSLYYSKDLKAGTVIEYNDLKICRPALGAHPKHMWEIIGTTLKHDVKENDPVNDQVQI